MRPERTELRRNNGFIASVDGLRFHGLTAPQMSEPQGRHSISPRKDLH